MQSLVRLEKKKKKKLQLEQQWMLLSNPFFTFSKVTYSRNAEVKCAIL